MSPDLLELLRAPGSLEPLTEVRGAVIAASGARFAVTDTGIPLFAETIASHDARQQQAHYDAIAGAYLANLAYPHTQEYMAYLDERLLDAAAPAGMGAVAEICCGRGEAFHLLGSRVRRGVGVDVSVKMLEAAVREHAGRSIVFVQGEATRLPLASAAFDSVFMLGGIHHVNERQGLFDETARILKPGGRFVWREPVSDFFLWRWIRAVVYKVSPILDDATERPLVYEETVPYLDRAGLRLQSWRTFGFLGFCLFMNSDVLVFNRLFRFVPGIRALTRGSARLDDVITRWPALSRAGLQVVGVAVKPA